MSKKNKNQKVNKEVNEMDDEKIIDETCKDVEDPEEEKDEKQEDNDTEPEKKGILSWVTVKEKRRKAESYVFAFALGAGACFGGMWGIGKYLEGKDVAKAIDPVTKEIPNLVSDAIGDNVSDVAADVVAEAMADTV